MPSRYQTVDILPRLDALGTCSPMPFESDMQFLLRGSRVQLSQAERNRFLPALDDTVSDDVLAK